MKNEFLSKVFRWLGLGLLVTFAVAYFTSTNLYLLSFVFNGPGYIVILLLELFLAIWLSARIHNMSSTKAKILYLSYSALTGLTFSSIFIVYELTSIIWIFLASSLVFFIFSFIGSHVDIDLGKYGIYLFILLLGSVLLEVINIFLLNETLDIILCIVILGIFVAYIAYDIQKILKLYDNSEKMAIYGAFDLYLDFINLFIRLLRLFGRERD